MQPISHGCLEHRPSFIPPGTRSPLSEAILHFHAAMLKIEGRDTNAGEIPMSADPPESLTRTSNKVTTLYDAWTADFLQLSFQFSPSLAPVHAATSQRPKAGDAGLPTSGHLSRLNLK
jgi:hypothetical protein